MKDLKYSLSRTKKLNLNNGSNHFEVKQYRDYPSRWGILATVFCLNLANNALWISFSSIATTAAEYYENTVRYGYIYLYFDFTDCFFQYFALKICSTGLTILHIRHCIQMF